MDTVLRRALSEEPEDRYPTCSDFVFAVENAFRSSKDWKPALPAGVFQNHADDRRSRWPAAATGASLSPKPKVRQGEADG